MPSSSSIPAPEAEEGEDLVVLILIDPSFAASATEDLEADEEGNRIATVSVADIGSCDLRRLLDSRALRVEVVRSRLVQRSSYFRGLLRGSFSESTLTQVPVQWDLESAVGVLRSIFDCPVDINSANFLRHLEAALFFGVEALLLECESWLSKATFLKGKNNLHVPTDVVIKIWNFGLEHGIDFISELCSGYVARNFVQVISCSCFVSVPYTLLYSSIKHPDLTVDSEKQLCQTLLDWISCNDNESDGPWFPEKFYDTILKSVQVSLLPLAYAAGLRRNKYFSMFVDRKLNVILSNMKEAEGALFSTKNDVLECCRIRLTDDSESIELGGCAGCTIAHLFLSLLPLNVGTTLMKEVMQALVEIDTCKADYCKITKKLGLSTFKGIRYVNLSKCPKIHFDMAVKLLSSAFPCLRVLKVTHCSNFKLEFLNSLAQSCPLLEEVDFSVDISPVISNQASVLSDVMEAYQFHYHDPYWTSKTISSLSSISKLTLEGRTDLFDLDLHMISKLMGSLSYINLKGCSSLTDVGLSEFILHCPSLHSLVVSYTSFGTKSVSSFCSACTSDFFSDLHPDHQLPSSMAFRFLLLHADACKGIGPASMKLLMSHIFMLKSLSLSATCLVEESLYDFRGISLEELDVSETMVSLESLVCLIQNNVALKRLKVNGCRNLHKRSNKIGFFHLDSKDRYQEFSKEYCLEEVAFGWGFSFCFMDSLNLSFKYIRKITLSIGATLDQQMLLQLPQYCPLLESVVLKFQVISDDIIKGLLRLRYLLILGIRCCMGDLTFQALQVNAMSLRHLRLEWVCPWMTNADLATLTQNCPKIGELSLSGCRLLNSESQQIISSGWPGLTCIHLEECGTVTAGQNFSIFDCEALEDLLLRHSGNGIGRNFIVFAASQLPLLRKIALDLCDACEGGFDSPSRADRFFLNTVTIARCKSQRCSFDLQGLGTFRPMHYETIVLEWDSRQQRTTIVKERL